MRRQFIPRTPRLPGARFRQLITQLSDLPRQCIQILLLADDDLVELLHQVFGKAGLDFEICQTPFDVFRGHGASAGLEPKLEHMRCVILLKTLPHGTRLGNPVKKLQQSLAVGFRHGLGDIGTIAHPR